MPTPLAVRPAIEASSSWESPAASLNPRNRAPNEPRRDPPLSTTSRIPIRRSARNTRSVPDVFVHCVWEWTTHGRTMGTVEDHGRKENEMQVLQDEAPTVLAEPRAWQALAVEEYARSL